MIDVCFKLNNYLIIYTIKLRLIDANDFWVTVDTEVILKLVINYFSPWLWRNISYCKANMFKI